MDIDQIETFLAVAALGGFHKAADGLRLSQPCVSARVKALEQSLGVGLFTRNKGVITLSIAGRALRPHAEQVMRTVALARHAVSKPRVSSGTTVRITAELGVCTYLLPAIIEQFRRFHPKIAICLRSAKADAKDTLHNVLQGNAELGVARSLYHPEIEAQSLRTDPIVLVGSTRHYAPNSRVSLAELAQWPLVLFDRGSIDWTIANELFHNAGLMPYSSLEVETLEAAKKMVQCGLGVTFIPMFAVRKEINDRDLTPILITDAEPLEQSLHIIHHKHRPLSAEAGAFLEVIANSAGERISTRQVSTESLHERLKRLAQSHSSPF